MSEYPYVDEEGWVYFGKEFIVEQFAETKWNGRMKKRYISLGYKFTKMYDIFDIDVRHLSEGSSVKVSAICPVCEEVRDSEFYSIMTSGHSKCFTCVQRDDIQGLSYGDLTAIEFVKSIKGDAVWLCECKCGGTKEVRAMSLKSGYTRSCGCMIENDLTGKVFERWTVLEQTNTTGRSIWLCECECGEVREVTASTLLNGTKPY